jgi:hypothetical protein
MAAEVGLTQSAVHRIWKAFGLQPHRQDSWKLSKDPQFVAKVRDVVGLYLNESDGFAWPQRDGLKWPHLALVGVVVHLA